MNVNTYIDIKLTEEDVKKIIAEFINKKYGGAINVDQYDIEIHVGMEKETLQRNHVLKMPLCTIDLARKRG